MSYNFKVVYVSPQEMNKKLKGKAGCIKISQEVAMERNCYGTAPLIVQDDKIYFYLWKNEGTVKKRHIVCYCCRKDNEDYPSVSPIQVYAALRRSCEFPIEKGESIFDRKISGMLYNNPKYRKQWVDAVSYDMNSAYGWAACQPMPDTTKYPKKPGLVQQGEIGFNRHGELRFPGEYAAYRFNTIESPFKEYMNRWYNKKRYAKDKKEKNKAKAYITYSVGYLQKEQSNFWLRATIVGYCNRLIMKLTGAHYDIDTDSFITENDNILYGNTDSIVVKKGYKLDLEIGEEMGEWKIEHDGQFAFAGFNCQWKGNLPGIRGINKSAFKKDWDITKDKYPKKCKTLYRFDDKEGQLIEDEENETESDC